MWRRKFLSMSPALFISFNLSTEHKQFVIDQRTLFIAIVSSVYTRTAVVCDVYRHNCWLWKEQLFNEQNFSDNFWVFMVATSSSFLKHLQVVTGILMFDHRHTIAHYWRRATLKRTLETSTSQKCFSTWASSAASTFVVGCDVWKNIPFVYSKLSPFKRLFSGSIRKTINQWRRNNSGYKSTRHIQSLIHANKLFMET